MIADPLAKMPRERPSDDPQTDAVRAKAHAVDVTQGEPMSRRQGNGEGNIPNSSGGKTPKDVGFHS